MPVAMSGQCSDRLLAKTFPRRCCKFMAPFLPLPLVCTCCFWLHFKNVAMPRALIALAIVCGAGSQKMKVLPSFLASCCCFLLLWLQLFAWHQSLLMLTPRSLQAPLKRIRNIATIIMPCISVNGFYHATVKPRFLITLAYQIGTAR